MSALFFRQPIEIEDAVPAGTALAYHDLASLFPLIEGEAFDELVRSVAENGLREPIIVFEGKILDGRNRDRACRAAGVTPRFEALPPGVDPVLYVIDRNLRRRHLTDDQRRLVAARLVNLGRGRPENAANSGISRVAAAELLSVDEPGVERARAVMAHGAPALAEAVARGDASVSAAAAIARLPHAKQVEILDEIRRSPDGKRAFAKVAKEARAETQNTKKTARAVREEILGERIKRLPEARFGVIYADPPWRFEPRSRETGMDRAADNHYPTQPLDDIKALDVASIAAPDCALFLWATAPMLPQALEVMAAWGFAHRSHCIWYKLRPGDQRGTGYWFHNEHEILLLGIRGDVPCPAPGTQWPSVIEAEVGAHSAKPDIFAELIEAYFPTLPKIELFARSPRANWERWGLEAPE